MGLGMQVGSESLWGSSIALPGSEVEPALTKSEKILRKQISALQVWPFF